MYAEKLKYTQTHEWIEIKGKEATIGITQYAANEIGDIVYIELPRVGDNLKEGSPFGAIESVKAVFDLNTPLSGEVIRVNDELNSRLEYLKNNAYEEWMIKMKLSNPEEAGNLLDFKEYQKLVGEDKK